LVAGAVAPIHTQKRWWHKQFLNCPSFKKSGVILSEQVHRQLPSLVIYLTPPIALVNLVVSLAMVRLEVNIYRRLRVRQAANSLSLPPD
jgi:hypothetical protein